MYRVQETNHQSGMQYQLGRALACSRIRGAGQVDTCMSWGMGRQIGVARERLGMTTRGQD